MPTHVKLSFYAPRAVHGQGFIISDLGLIFVRALGVVAFAAAGWALLVLAWAALAPTP